MSILKGLFTLLLSAILEFIWGKYKEAQKEKEEKAQEDRQVDEAVKKVETGDLEEGLDGTEALQDAFNTNARKP